MIRQDVSEFNGAETLGKRRFKTLARLAADWYWQLDSSLCFVFYDGKSNSLSGKTSKELAGVNRIELLHEHFEAHPEIVAHEQALKNHQAIDHVITLIRDGKAHHVRVIAEPEYDSDGQFAGYLGCSRDVTEHVIIESRLAHLATHDDLTGVLNRREFERRLELVCQDVKHKGRVCSLCFIDLDKFKIVNDSAGHAAGDQLLRELAGIMHKHVQPDECLGRMGGDEFCIILNANGATAKKVADAIINAIVLYRFKWEEQQFSVGASIGITELDKDVDDVDQLLLVADNACYTAKNNGRNQSYYSNESSISQQMTVHRLAMIRQALRSNQYRLLMQPIVNATSKDTITRYEVLLRLECKNGDLLEPAEFLPLAKQYDLMRELDRWVVNNSINAMERLQDANENMTNKNLAAKRNVSKTAFHINLSASTLCDQLTLDSIASLIERSSIPAECICFEINETTAIRNLDELIQFMDEMSTLGVEFALDDFGNGSSSVTDVQRLPIDYLKIDHSLIAQVLQDSCGRAIVKSIHHLSRQLGIKTIAEAVEDTVTASLLQQIGVDYMQGFAIAELSDMRDYLTANAHDTELKAFTYQLTLDS